MKKNFRKVEKKVDLYELLLLETLRNFESNFLSNEVHEKIQELILYLSDRVEMSFDNECIEEIIYKCEYTLIKDIK